MIRRRRRTPRVPPARAASTTRAWAASQVIRWPAILLFAAAIAAMAAVETGADGTSSGATPADGSAASTVGDADALASAWYCAAGSIVEGGVGDHVVILANAGNAEADVTLTIVPVLAPEPIEIDLDGATDDATADDGTTDDGSTDDGSTDDATTEADDPGDPLDTIDDSIGRTPQAVLLDVVDESVVVPAHSIVRVRLADVEGVGGEFAAALVESDLGDLLVEHQISGPAGDAIAPCASSSSANWYFGAGTTRKGSQQYLAVFNPFPGDAVVDITLTVDGVRRSPRAYDGLVVPSGAVVPVDISNVVTLFDSVAATVSARTGRIVVDRLLVFDGSEGPAGLSVSTGLADPAGVWALPGGVADAPTAIVVYNPSENVEAVVDVELHPVTAADMVVEPVGVTVRPGHAEIVVLDEGAERITTGRVVDGSDRITDGTPFWVAVRQVRGGPVVVERLVVADAGSGWAAAASPATSVSATRHLFTTGSGGGAIAIAHPATDRIALADLTVHVDGEVFSVETIELSPGDRIVVDFAAFGIPPDALVVLDTSEPVVVERRVDVDAGSAWSPVAAQGTGMRALQIPFG